jgi:hypothetical protein
MNRPPSRVAVMQPYFFPYLGSYQLAQAVDTYVHFDDVAFIKKGFIHRNRLLYQGRAHDFSVPVRHMSQNRTIAEHDYTGDFAPFLNLVHQAYRRAPFFDSAFSLIEAVALDPDHNVARKNARSLQAVLQHWSPGPKWAWASDQALPDDCRGQARILSLCQQHRADVYVNASGGRSLYDAAEFERHGMALRFLDCACAPYAQASVSPFVANLSVIDVLMHCSTPQALQLLGQYRLGP